MTKSDEENRARPGPPPEYHEPVGEVERRLAAVLARVLGLERVGRDDNFFELGGDSITAIQLLAIVRDELGINLPVRTIFESPTASGMAKAVEELLESNGRP
jgi:acyl carrier protein